MPYANPKSQVAMQSSRETSMRMYHKKRAIVDAAKSVPCLDCGVQYPVYVMDLDHVDGNDKVLSVNEMMRSRSIQALTAEIAKCEPVCSNCHRGRTHRRRLSRAVAQRNA